ncbi:MAG: SixA phosphatase family protein [Planctomycetota bacterium]|jgi:phosphohistidine phosphatase
MKCLLLLRHAKSGGKGTGTPDHDRPLNRRGERDAPRMGGLLRGEDLLPDLVLSSTAERARCTTVAALEHGGYDGPVEYLEELYHASPDEMMAMLRERDDDSATIMLVGHNPGMEDLLLELTGVDEHFPTAALAVIGVDVDRWADLRRGVRCSLSALWRPREL